MAARRPAHDRAEAMRLRREGYSIPEIAQELGIARSTAWLWTGDVPLARPRKSRGPGSPGSLVLTRREVERLNRKKAAAQTTMRIHGDAALLALGAVDFPGVIHETGDVAAAEAFWAEVIGVPVDRLSRTVLKRSRPRTNRRNRADGYYGLVAIRVRQSKELYQQVEGWMRGAADAVAGRVATDCSRLPGA